MKKTEIIVNCFGLFLSQAKVHTKMVEIKPKTGLISGMNPVQDKLHFIYETEIAMDVSFEIYSIQGKLLKHQVFAVWAGQNALEWEVDDLPNGIYSVKAVGRATKVVKILVQR